LPIIPISETYQDQGVAFVSFSFWSMGTKALNSGVLDLGERLGLIYRLASDREMSVWLVASMVHEQQDYYSASQDVQLTLHPGVHSYERKFTVHPSWPIGAYSLVVSVLQKPERGAAARLAVWRYPRPILVF
jgi:hypothetical protein